jgi:hypothetical protein
MAFFGASTLINSLGGGAVGGAMGYANTGDWQGALGGAAAGAAFGGLGGGKLGNWGGQMMTRGAGKGLNGLARKFDPYTPLRKYESMGMRNSVNKARDWFRGGGNIGVNKWGSRAATAAGLGAASYIGSSMISSNNGY